MKSTNSQQFIFFLQFYIILLSLIVTACSESNNIGDDTREIIKEKQEINFIADELIGKPTNESITINIVPENKIEYHYQYGIISGRYNRQTPDNIATGGKPHETIINELTPDTKYYYRMRYRKPDSKKGEWITKNEHSFMTQRAKGRPFTFVVMSDTHHKLNDFYTVAMKKIMEDHPDFVIDLGDTFFAEEAKSQDEINKAYLSHRNNKFMGYIGHSIPIFLSPGNHEDEEGWNLDDRPFSLGVANIQARKAYFPTPIDEGDKGFYKGNTNPLSSIHERIYGDELREDYYSFEWGEALFLIIDPFQYTKELPYYPVAGELKDDTVTGDQWSWTLGPRQYKWLIKTLENTKASYKFLFSHNMTGGIPRRIVGVRPGYVRGGAEASRYFEWGGEDKDGTWGFTEYRNATQYGTKPIHQILVESSVSAYFHGHDHMYAYEKRDGIVYQAVPSPTMFKNTAFPGIYNEGKYDDYETIKVIPNMGYLRITVTSGNVKVEYVRTNKNEVSYTYMID